jgi:hypothetical protein
MANVFYTQRDIAKRYDLKGSTIGRQVIKKEGQTVDPTVALKDIDFVKSGEKINLSPVSQLTRHSNKLSKTK